MSNFKEYTLSMKRKVHQQLKYIADELPLIFIEEVEFVDMPGYELRLTPYDDRMTINPSAVYRVRVPLFRAIDHAKEVKAAYKAGGMLQVKKYCQSVMDTLDQD